MSAIENFLRRWSTVDITDENAFFFEEHLMGVQVLASTKDKKILQGLTRSTPRAEFAKRYQEYCGISQAAKLK
jgi:hypothetical protein